MCYGVLSIYVITFLVSQMSIGGQRVTQFVVGICHNIVKVRCGRQLMVIIQGCVGILGVCVGGPCLCVGLWCGVSVGPAYLHRGSSRVVLVY